MVCTHREYLAGMARIAKSTSPERGAGRGHALKILVSQDGHLEFAAPTPPAGRRRASEVVPASAITVDLNSAADEAVIAANRARVQELRSTRSSGIPDFPDALVASVTQIVPGLSQAMTTLGLKDAGLLPEDAVIAGASALACIANWLADRGYGPEPSEPLQPAPALVYDNAVGLVAWLLLDWIHRSIAATEVDDNQLEDDLDAYYPRWSRTDFEWDITRVGREPLLNPYSAASPNAGHSTDQAAIGRPSTVARRRVHTLINSAPGFARTAVHSVDPSIRTDRRARLNRARQRRQR